MWLPDGIVLLWIITTLVTILVLLCVALLALLVFLYLEKLCEIYHIVLRTTPVIFQKVIVINLEKLSDNESDKELIDDKKCIGEMEMEKEAEKKREKEREKGREKKEEEEEEYKESKEDVDEEETREKEKKEEREEKEEEKEEEVKENDVEDYTKENEDEAGRKEEDMNKGNDERKINEVEEEDKEKQKHEEKMKDKDSEIVPTRQLIDEGTRSYEMERETTVPKPFESPKETEEMETATDDMSKNHNWETKDKTEKYYDNKKQLFISGKQTSTTESDIWIKSCQENFYPVKNAEVVTGKIMQYTAHNEMIIDSSSIIIWKEHPPDHLEFNCMIFGDCNFTRYMFIGNEQDSNVSTLSSGSYSFTADYL